MDLLEQTKELCRLYDIKPARSKGQNFLIKEEIYCQIADAAGLTSNDTVLEVGPGLGFLTVKLAQKAGRVIAVELDDKLAEVLKIGLVAKGINNVEVVNDDILKSSLPSFAKDGYKVVANLPYNITSFFLRKFLSEIEIKPKSMVLMLQEEVAKRITAKPGKMSLLAVSAQFYAQPEIIKLVSKDCFWPKPEVDSAIVKLKVESKKLKVKLSSDKERDFFRLVKFGFSAKRKMLKNNLASGLRINQAEAENKITDAGFNPKIRAQELSVEDWLKLFANF